MKLNIFRFAIFALCGICSPAKAGVVPDGYPVGRYSSLWEHSPFTIASVQQEVVPAGFASKLALVSVGRIGSADMVILLDKDSQERITVSSDSADNTRGLKLVSIEPDTEPLKASVTIQKGAEVAKVKYDPSLLAATTAPPPVPGANGIPQPGQTIPGQPPPPPMTRVRRTLPIPSPYMAPPVNSVPNPPPR